MPSPLFSRKQIPPFVLKTAGSDNNIKYHSSYINDENWEKKTHSKIQEIRSMFSTGGFAVKYENGSLKDLVAVRSL